MPFKKSMKRKANVNYRPRKRTIARKSPLTKKYTRIKQQQKIRQMKRTVKKAKSRAISAMAVLRQPTQVVMKFKTQSCKVYRLHDITGPAAGTTVNNDSDSNPVFPVNGIVVHQNSIFQPGETASHLPRCGGFTDVSHQYGKYRVIGSKIVFKVRRIGSAIPMSIGAHSNYITPITSNGVTPAMLPGTAMDPDNADPLLVTAFDRSAWQDVNSMVRGAESEIGMFSGASLLRGYADVQKYKHLKGLTWRELKAGPGRTSTIIHKWSEKKHTSAGHNSDIAQINTGLFHNEQGSYTAGGGNPSTLDKVRFDIKEFDEIDSLQKSRLSNPRVMVTIDVDYLVLCTEPRYTYSQPN
jgi:hypothetical protein